MTEEITVEWWVTRPNGQVVDVYDNLKEACCDAAGKFFNVRAVFSDGIGNFEVEWSQILAYAGMKDNSE